MALWLVRAGRHGEHEQDFLDGSRLYLTWGEFKLNLSGCKSKEDVRKLLLQYNPNLDGTRLSNQAGQIWTFAHRIKVGDWVLLPSKKEPSVHIADVLSEYHFDANASAMRHHWRNVKWIATDLPRSNFDQDLLYSMGSLLTICQIRRNDAEKRIRAMARSGWITNTKHATDVPDLETNGAGDGEEDPNSINLEQVARDAIAKLLVAKFKGHGMARLVEAILQAQGFTTYCSPPGPDKGVDLLAAPGPMGFGTPRICIQVKSGDTPLDRPTLDQLVGTMQNVQAEQGLLVWWGGFKSSVHREEAAQFFRVRLWNQADLIEQLLANYEKTGRGYSGGVAA